MLNCVLCCCCHDSNYCACGVDIDEVDGEGQNILMGIIGQLRLGSDLSRITLPTFILERKSMLERITNQLQHQMILVGAHAIKDPTARFVEVVKWNLAGWHITPKAVKKPLNPVLGEYFSCYWDLPNGTTSYYISEQTSHHPPKSSYFYMSPENGIRIDGTLFPRSKFLGNSAAAMMQGVGFLQFMDILGKDGKPEQYEFTQPNIYARGILIGKLKYELGDHSIVSCPQLDLCADVEFKTKGFISGTFNAIAGSIKTISTGQTLFEITGKWNDVIEILDVRANHKRVLFDANTAQPLPPKTRPISEQGELESRRLWSKVFIALSKRDHKAATAEKSAIEDGQRLVARKRTEDGVEFAPKMFRPVKESRLEFELYKKIDGKTPQRQIEQICSVAPILPGQQFNPHFEIPAYQKHSLPKDEPEGETTGHDAT